MSADNQTDATDATDATTAPESAVHRPRVKQAVAWYRSNVDVKTTALIILGALVAYSYGVFGLIINAISALGYVPTSLILPGIATLCVGAVILYANFWKKDGEENQSRAFRATQYALMLAVAFLAGDNLQQRITGNVDAIAVTASAGTGTAPTATASFENINAVSAAAMFSDNSRANWYAYAGWAKQNGRKIDPTAWKSSFTRYTSWSGTKLTANDPSVKSQQQSLANEVGVEVDVNGNWQGKPGQGVTNKNALDAGYKNVVSNGNTTA